MDIPSNPFSTFTSQTNTLGPKTSHTWDKQNTKARPLGAQLPCFRLRSAHLRGLLASLLGTRTLLGAPGHTTGNKKLLGTKGIEFDLQAIYNTVKLACSHQNQANAILARAYQIPDKKTTTNKIHIQYICFLITHAQITVCNYDLSEHCTAFIHDIPFCPFGRCQS